MRRGVGAESEEAIPIQIVNVENRAAVKFDFLARSLVNLSFHHWSIRMRDSVGHDRAERTPAEWLVGEKISLL